MEKLPTVIVEVEEFLKRFHEGDSVVTPEAKTLMRKEPKKTKLGLSHQEVRNYPDRLGWAIAAYELHKDRAPFPDRVEMAYELLDIIERGRTHGVIKDNIRLTDKFKECQDENKQLKETKIQLEAEILRLKRDNEELHKLVDDLGGKRIGNISRSED